MKRLNDGHIDTIKYWATRDAAMALSGEHSAGRQAEIRLHLIKRMETIDEEDKRYLYNRYLRILEVGVKAGNPRIRYSVPEFDEKEGEG